MPKFVSIAEAATRLETTANSICVGVHSYKKQNGEYPSWYISNGKRGRAPMGTSNTLIDLDAVLAIRAHELKCQIACSSDLYWHIKELVGIRPSNIARYMAAHSQLYPSVATWLSFMHHELFCEPVKKISPRVTRMSEFYRLCTQLIKEHDEGRLDERYFKTRQTMATA